MAIPKNKSELILAINDSYTKLREDLVATPLEWVAIKELDGHAKGTKMSVKKSHQLSDWLGRVSLKVASFEN